eukprot:16056998-Heterocapsa_arctica.AAC.1
MAASMAMRSGERAVAGGVQGPVTPGGATRPSRKIMPTIAIMARRPFAISTTRVHEEGPNKTPKTPTRPPGGK